jgi:hypothetical protein
MFDLSCATKHLFGVGSDDLDQIGVEFPGTSVERFERSRRRLCGLRSGFRITDVDTPLQALEWVPVGAEQILEEANLVCGHHTPPYQVTANAVLEF